MVPAREDTRRLREAIAAAQATMEVPDRTVLTEEQWSGLEAVLTAMVPDFAREDSSEAERRLLLAAVGEAMEEVQARAEEALGAWKGEFAREIERRKGQEIDRSLLRVIVQAWREEADGRRVASLRKLFF